ncbi:hypothetical protein [Streptomyces sp. NPDC086010]|uniref:hypothetical protein n=1 Tax=Streptomyces sp. NPDC086010 TaxID=3365745 RepID=UPI0037D2C80D
MGRSQVLLSQHRSRDGDTSYLSSTESVAAKLRGTGVKMVARYNDLMGGWPYVWKGVDDWVGKVDSATRSIQKYKGVLHSVAPLIEPDNKLGPQAGSPFMTDPRVPGDTYDAKVEWLWTETVRRIRAIDPSVKVMSPNYEHNNPWEAADRQPRMRAFLVNAKNTGTLPDIIGWHSLGPSPGDVPESLTRYYRPLEKELGISPRPVMIEEYGPGDGEFEGVPGNHDQALGRVRPLRGRLRGHGHLHQFRAAREHPAPYLGRAAAQRWLVHHELVPRDAGDPARRQPLGHPPLPGVRPTAWPRGTRSRAR